MNVEEIQLENGMEGNAAKHSLGSAPLQQQSLARINEAPTMLVMRELDTEVAALP